MTQKGGDIWSLERLPDWNRYCTERYPAFIGGRTIVSVQAVAAIVRDHFLELWPKLSPRRKTATIRDRGLIPWHPFGTIHVGLASYLEPSHQPEEDANAYFARRMAHAKNVEAHRSWWRSVYELQKFHK